MTKQEENGKRVWYERLEHCPHLDAIRKHKPPDLYPLVCDMDWRLGQQYKAAQWEKMPAGDTECRFKTKRCIAAS
jgi:hypothetical protein